MMTPKEKAKELVEKYKEIESFHIHKRIIIMPLPEAKQCALIAVDEMINVCYWNTTKEFLLEVKKEIEAL